MSLLETEMEIQQPSLPGSEKTSPPVDKAEEQLPQAETPTPPVDKADEMRFGGLFGSFGSFDQLKKNKNKKKKKTAAAKTKSNASQRANDQTDFFMQLLAEAHGDVTHACDVYNRSTTGKRLGQCSLQLISPRAQSVILGDTMLRFSDRL